MDGEVIEKTQDQVPLLSFIGQETLDKYAPLRQGNTVHDATKMLYTSEGSDLILPTGKGGQYLL